MTMREARRISQHAAKGPHERCTIRVDECTCNCHVCLKRKFQHRLLLQRMTERAKR